MPKIVYVVTLILILGSAVSAKDIPLMVGGHAHGVKNVQALADLGIGNFVWIPKVGYPMGNTLWDWNPQGANGIISDVDACVKNHLYFMISERRGLGTIVRPGGAEFGGDCSGDLNSAQTVRDIRQRAGDLFAGLHAEEMDIDLLQSALRPGFRSRIPDIYDFTDREGGRQHFESELARLNKLYHNYAPGVEFWPNLCATMQHSGFRVGADIVMAEFLESLPTTELQLAYLRGGARQFSGNWGAWVSPWYYGMVPCEDKKLWPVGSAVVGEGHSASAFKRCLYLAYGSGARVLTVQETEPLFSYKDANNPSAGYKLAAWGRELKSFWVYAKRHTEKMEPLIPLALMVDKNNGWAPGHLNGDWIVKPSVWGKLPVEQGDIMLSSYLDVLLPSFERNETNWWWKKGRTYPGYFTSTPAGAFDIVSSDISVDKLSQYPMVMLMGDIKMTRELLNVLRPYVKNGGNLYINVDQMRDGESFVQDVELLGAEIAAHTFYVDWVKGNVIGRNVKGSLKIVLKIQFPGMDKTQYDEPWFAMQDVKVKGAEVVADDGAGTPVLLRHKYGKGFAWLSTPEYMLEGIGNRTSPLNFFRALITGFSQAGEVTVTAPGSINPQADISWVASRQAGELAVFVVNHGTLAKDAEIICNLPNITGKLEVGSGAMDVKEGSAKTSFKVAIPAEDVAVLRIKLK